jgi:hypothetical protein
VTSAGLGPNLVSPSRVGRATSFLLLSTSRSAYRGTYGSSRQEKEEPISCQNIWDGVEGHCQEPTTRPRKYANIRLAKQWNSTRSVHPQFGLERDGDRRTGNMATPTSSDDRSYHAGSDAECHHVGRGPHHDLQRWVRGVCRRETSETHGWHTDGVVRRSLGASIRSNRGPW